jgi:cob(I)alamin adenosyltransferase
MRNFFPRMRHRYEKRDLRKWMRHRRSSVIVSIMKVYTKTGDSGQTGLFGGARVVKSDLRIECYGTVDELNSVLGLVSAELNSQEDQPTNPLTQQTVEIQCELFNLGSHLACGNQEMRSSLPALQETFVERIENWIDEMDSELPPLKTFILPGGHPVAAQLHLARTVCRRAERRLVELQQETPKDHQALGLRWLNRLSDYFFVAARFQNFKNEFEDIPWKPSTN